MATLNTYLRQTQRFVRDQSQQVLNPEDLIDYINQARREVALRTECLRVLPNISGPIISANVTSQGSGYTAPVVTITPPDFPSGAGGAPNGRQATAIALMSGGKITGLPILDGGDGYFQPSITITDPTGSGAVAVPNTVPLSVTTQGQEVYPFSFFDLSPFPGIASIHMIRGVAVIFSQFRYMLKYACWSEYQALVRQYSSGFYQYVPAVFSQFGQGAAGSLYLYPIPNQTYQIEVDCCCLPSDLLSDGDPEALPDPWCDAVPWFAAHLAYLELQNIGTAQMYLKMFEDRVGRYSHAARPGRRINPYGRG